MRVRVHWNLHIGGWTVLRKVAGRGWLVFHHADTLSLTACKWIVSKASRKRCQKEAVRNVHAFVEGIIDSLTPQGVPRGGRKVTYRPFDSGPPSFVMLNGAPVDTSERALFLSDGSTRAWKVA